MNLLQKEHIFLIAVKAFRLTFMIMINVHRMYIKSCLPDTIIFQKLLLMSMLFISTVI